MRAAVCRRYGPPEVLQIEEVPTPVPAENEVLVRVRATVAATAECAARKGSPIYARLAFGLTKPRVPILGSELVGVVEAVGARVTRFRPGDAVFGATGIALGGYAEFICLPEDGALVAKPAGLTDAQAAAICEGGLTALPFLRDSAKLRPGQTIAINGASGAVGAVAVQLAKHFGAQVIGVCSAANADLVRSLGADRVIDYSTSDFTRVTNAYDVVFDAVGLSSYGRCKRALKPGGIYLTTVPSMAIFVHALAARMKRGRRGSIAFTGLRKPALKTADLLTLKELAESGALRAVIDSTHPLEDAAAGHRRAESGHKVGSAIITID